MSQNTVRSIEKSIQKLNEWTNGITAKMQWEDREFAYTAIRAVLHALRDRLSVAEVADFGAELPLVIRGVYYEGWNPAKNPIKMGRSEFIKKVHSYFNYDPLVEPEKIIHMVFDVIHKHIPNGEMRDILTSLPKDIAKLVEA